MTRLKTVEFSLVAGLSCLLFACGDDATSDSPSAGGALDAGSTAVLDAAWVHDASGHPTTPKDASAGDASVGTSVDLDDVDGGLPFPCSVSSTTARCSSKAIEMIGAPSDLRRVYWNQPSVRAPAAGYPVVILYQGSFFGPSTSWDTELDLSTPFGGYYQVALVAKLLADGYVVIQPEAQGGLFWSTNSSANYDSSVDGVFIPLLLRKLHDGAFGALDLSRLYATGISSGGYMTSRMAVSYAGQFRALAIESGSYATCLGPLCNIPSALPKDHPPTLLLHGGADTTVPIATARDYEAKLMSSGIESKFVEDPAAGHQWLSSAPDDVSAWFDAH